MLTPILPLRMIVFQVVLLLVAIALESIVLRRSLRLPYRTSVEYAASINLLATCVGWILFFFLEPLLPLPLKEQLIGYVLFDHFFVNDWVQSIPIWIVTTGLVAFFVTFFVKFQGLELLLLLLNRREAQTPTRGRSQRMRSRGRQARQSYSSPIRARINAVLRANGLSFSAVLLLLLLRAVLQTM